MFNFIGIIEVSYVRAEGVAISPETQREAIAQAERDIAELALAYPKAA